MNESICRSCPPPKISWCQDQYDIKGFKKKKKSQDRDQGQTRIHLRPREEAQQGRCRPATRLWLA